MNRAWNIAFFINKWMNKITFLHIHIFSTKRMFKVLLFTQLNWNTTNRIISLSRQMIHFSFTKLRPRKLGLKLNQYHKGSVWGLLYLCSHLGKYTNIVFITFTWNVSLIFVSPPLTLTPGGSIVWQLRGQAVELDITGLKWVNSPPFKVGKDAYLFWAFIFSFVCEDNNTYITELLWGLDEILHPKDLTQWPPTANV